MTKNNICKTHGKLKVKHTSFEDALEHIRIHQQGCKEPVSAYPCSICSYWHVGRYSPKGMQMHERYAKIRLEILVDMLIGILRGNDIVVMPRSKSPVRGLGDLSAYATLKS